MDQPTPTHPPHPRAVILRCYLDENGQLRGRLDDPTAETRATFIGGDELVSLVLKLVSLDVPPEGQNS